MSYRINLIPNASYTETVSVSQDDAGREIVIDLYKGGEAYTIPSGTVITMHGTKPSGLGYTITGTNGTTSVTFETTAEMTEESGRFASELVLTNGDTVIGTANFALFVEKSPHPASTIDGTGETMQNLETRISALEGADGITAGYVPTAQGDGTWEWAQGGSGDGLTDGIKQALLQLAQKVAYVDANGATYYQNLYDAFYPPANLVGISAVYTQSGTVYTTASLDDLKADLVVTALFDDSTTRTLTDSEYALSGMLTEGTNTVTVAYGGKTATFYVAVTEYTTTVTIATEGVCWSKTAPNTVAKDGFGISDWYDYTFTQELLESSPYWDATNEYMSTSGWSGIQVCSPDYETYAAGYSWPASANYKNALGQNHVYVNQNAITRNTQNNWQFNRQSTNHVTDNCFSASIPLFDKEYAYAYWHSNLANAIYPSGISDGDIIYAGRNTPYFGLHNISEAPTLESITATFTQGGTAVTTSTTLASLKAMLSVTASYDNGRTHDVNRGLVALTGTLTEGTSTITATYNDKTDTFDVVVTS